MVEVAAYWLSRLPARPVGGQPTVSARARARRCRGGHCGDADRAAEQPLSSKLRDENHGGPTGEPRGCPHPAQDAVSADWRRIRLRHCSDCDRRAGRPELPRVSRLFDFAHRPETRRAGETLSAQPQALRPRAVEPGPAEHRHASALFHRQLSERR